MMEKKSVSTALLYCGNNVSTHCSLGELNLHFLIIIIIIIEACTLVKTSVSMKSNFKILLSPQNVIFFFQAKIKTNSNPSWISILMLNPVQH